MRKGVKLRGEKQKHLETPELHLIGVAHLTIGFYFKLELEPFRHHKALPRAVLKPISSFIRIFVAI